jgi:fermentation-respiration switch protein FrsA (DUF1100 family)
MRAMPFLPETPPPLSSVACPRPPARAHPWARLPVREASALALFLLVLASAASETESSPAGPQGRIVDSIQDGRWVGVFENGGGWEPLSIRLIRQGGLLDLPADGLYGFPLVAIVRTSTRLDFALFGSSKQVGPESPAALGELTAESGVVFDGRLVQPAGGTAPRVEGRWRRLGGGGAFWLEPAPPPLGKPYVISTGWGDLPGTLLLPDAPTSPVVLLLPGAGGVDRDGNNYQVPGRNDSLAILAEELLERGIASLRYDKRGSGEAYRLVASEEDLVFADYVEDAASAIRALALDGRFTRIVVAGHAEGALVGAAALRISGISRRPPGQAARPSPCLALLCASGKSGLDIVVEGLADSPEELRPELEAIMEALIAGGSWPDPSPYFAEFFRPSFQPYLASWFRYDLRDELESAPWPLLFVHGGRDLQVSLAELDDLLGTRPDATAIVLPGMNHILKEVSADEEENYQAFTDPRYPPGEGLADALAAFARTGSAPRGIGIAHRPRTGTREIH